MEVLEILAYVEDLKVDEVLEVLWKGAQAVETNVEDAEGGHVGERVREEDQLVGVDRQLPYVAQLKPYCVRKFVQLVEVGVQLF